METITYIFKHEWVSYYYEFELNMDLHRADTLNKWTKLIQ